MAQAKAQNTPRLNHYLTIPIADLGIKNTAVVKSLEGVIAYDGGNGTFQLAWVSKKKLHIITIPHGRTRIDGRKHDSEMAVYEVQYADFMGNRWGFGDEIFEINGILDTHQNTELRYGEEPHVFYCLLMMAMMGIKTRSEMKLIMNVPPQHLDRVGAFVKETFKAGDPEYKNTKEEGWWRISLGKTTTKTDRPFFYKFSSVGVMHEGTGAWNLFRFNLDGKPHPLEAKWGDALSGTTIVGDSGMGTFDQFAIQNGKIVADSLDQATDSGGGIMAHVIEPLHRELLEMTGASWIKPAHIDYWIRGYMNGKHNEAGQWCAPRTPEAGTVIIGGLRAELANAFETRFAEYGNWVINNKVDPARRGIHNAYLPVGGGWNLMGDWVKNARGDYIHMLFPQDYEHTRLIPSHAMNVVGLLAWMAAYLKAQAS